MSDGTTRGVVAAPKATPLLQPGMPLMILQHPRDPKTKYLDAPDLHPVQFAFDVVIEVNENASRVRYKVNSEPGSSGHRASIRTGTWSPCTMPRSARHRARRIQRRDPDRHDPRQSSG
jgi:hypothetical protein